MTDKNGGRVSTREFYEALLNQNERMDEIERRTIRKIDELGANLDSKFASLATVDECHRLEGRIDKNADRLNEGDRANKLIVAIGTVIAAILGAIGVAN